MTEVGLRKSEFMTLAAPGGPEGALAPFELLMLFGGPLEQLLLPLAEPWRRPDGLPVPLPEIGEWLLFR